MFYCQSHTTRIIKSDRTVYFEEDVVTNVDFVPREITFGEEYIAVHFPSHVPIVDAPIVQEPVIVQEESNAKEE